MRPSLGLTPKPFVGQAMWRGRLWFWVPASGWLIGLVLSFTFISSVHAVTFTEQIDRLQLVYSALLDYRSGGPPVPLQPGEFALGAELVPIPPIDNRVGAKDEPVNPPPAYGRARAMVGVGAGFAVGIAYLPPIPVSNYMAQLAGFAVEYDWRFDRFIAGARAFYDSADINGPITDPSTSDQFTATNEGLDVRAGWAFAPWTVYAGAGSGQTSSRLKVTSDGAVSKENAAYGFLFAGASRDFGAWRVALEQHQTENYLQDIVLTVIVSF